MPAEVLTSPLLSRAGFPHGFATRRGGVSAPPFDSLSFKASAGGDSLANVEENVRRVGVVVGFSPEALLLVSQVHGKGVVRVSGAPNAVRADGAKLEEGDAIVVERGRVAGIRVADCVAVLVGDDESGSAAAIHAGWRGVVLGVVGAALADLAVSGVGSVRGAKGRRVAAIGPCIGACCFEVGADVAAQIADACGDPRVIVRRAADKAFVDLRLAVRTQLRAAGLADEDIDDIPGCTRCDAARFFSYRRDGERSGRHIAVITGR